MEQLKRTLNLTGARIKQYEITPNEQTGKGVLIASAPLTAEQAEIMGCREMFFTEKGVAREFEGQVGIPLILKDTELKLGDEPYRPDMITKFKVGHDGDDENDITLYVTFRAHFTGHGNLGHLFDFVLKKNKGEFAVTMEPLQQQLFPEKDGAPAPVIDGKGKGIGRAAAEESGEKDTGCVACNNDIPMGAVPGRHASGAECTREQGPALASAREANGGTHAKRRRGPEAVN
jgi:hypothetical protein